MSLNYPHHSIGRRKCAIARVYLKEGKGKMKVNGRNYKEYFSNYIFLEKLLKAFSFTEKLEKFEVRINVSGGGINGQAEACRLAISRALCLINPKNRSILKSHGFLSSDSRKVERKKFGQKKARKKFQFTKR
jgi:small subunit ribosomal protein S9